MRYTLMVLFTMILIGCSENISRGCLDGKKFYSQRTDLFVEFKDGQIILGEQAFSYNCSFDEKIIFTDWKIYINQTGQSVLEHGFSKKGNEYVLVRATVPSWSGPEEIKMYYYLVN